MSSRIRFSPSLILYLCLAGSALGWGWSWVGIRMALPSYEPGQLAWGRYAVASLVLFPFWLWHGARLPAWRHLPVIALMGTTGFSIYNFFLNRGELTVTAGTAALLGASLPILIALGARCFFKEKLTFLGWLGVWMAFAGVAITSMGAHDAIHLSHGALSVLLAMVSGAVYGLLMKKMLVHYTPLEMTTWSIWFGDLVLMPFGRGLWQAASKATPEATMSMILLGIFPGALCYLLYAYCLSKAQMAQVASCLFLLPLISILLGWYLLGEFPSAMALEGGSITLLGAYLVNVKGKVTTTK